MAEYVLSAVLTLRDEFTARAKNAQKSIQGVKSAVESAVPSINGVSSVLDRAGRKADTTASKAERLKRSLSGVKGNYYATLKGRDELSPLLDKAQARLRRLSGSRAFVNIKAGISEKLQGGASGVANGLMMGAGLQMLGTAGIGLGLYSGIQRSMEFESAMSGVRAITNATQEDFEKLRNKALEMGATTKFTATESAQALNFMGMAGWDAEQSIKGLPGIMHLAAASGEDLAMVSDIVTDSMSAFKLGADRSSEFADVLAAAATKSNTNVGKMGFTFKYAAPLAGALGYSIQDVALAVGTMADSGIKGEMAGTSLRSLLTRMAKQPKQAAQAMQALGLSMTDATGKIKPFRTMLLEMRSAFKGLSEEQQTQYAALLAGTEGMSGLLAIVNGDEKKFNDLAKAIDESSGAAERMAKIRLDNLSGDLTYLSSAWDGFLLKIMKGNATSGLRGFVQEVNSLLNRFNKSVDENGLGVRSILGLVGDIVVDLKNKFLQLDGVGSVLAGGALAAGLYKLYGLTKSIAGLAAGPKVSIPGAGGVGGAMPSMTVQAATVFVNGKTVAGGGLPTPGGNAGAGGAPVPGGAVGGAAEAASRWGAFKSLNKFALPLAVGMTAYEAYNAEPEKRAETVGRGVAGIAGAEIGAAIGTAVAGPVGTFVGGIIGHFAGSAVMDNAVSGSMGNAPELDELKDVLRSTKEETAEDKAVFGKEYKTLTLSRFVDAELDDELRSGVKLEDFGLTETAAGIEPGIDTEASRQAVDIENATAAAWENLWKDKTASVLADYKAASSELSAVGAGSELSITLDAVSAGDTMAAESKKAEAWENLWKEKAASVMAAYQGAEFEAPDVSGSADTEIDVSVLGAGRADEALEAERVNVAAWANQWNASASSAVAAYQDMASAIRPVSEVVSLETMADTPEFSGAEIPASAVEAAVPDMSAVDGAMEAEAVRIEALGDVWKAVTESAVSGYQDMAEGIRPIKDTATLEILAEGPNMDEIEVSIAAVDTEPLLESETAAAESWKDIWSGAVQSRIYGYRDMATQIMVMSDEIESGAVSGLEISVSAIDAGAGKTALQEENETAAAWESLWSGVAQARVSEYQDMTSQISGMDSELAAEARDTGSSIVEAFRRSSEESMSVWSGVADWFRSVFSNISSAVSSIGSPGAVRAEVPAHATGTMNFRGGLAQINEHGGELVDLPSGSRIYPAQTTEQIIQRELQAPRNSQPTVNISGNTFVVREEADINKIAYELAQMIGMAELNYGGAG